jgi:hypothetical protein
VCLGIVFGRSVAGILKEFRNVRKFSAWPSKGRHGVSSHPTLICCFVSLCDEWPIFSETSATVPQRLRMSCLPEVECGRRAAMSCQAPCHTSSAKRVSTWLATHDIGNVVSLSKLLKATEKKDRLLHSSHLFKLQLWGRLSNVVASSRDLLGERAFSAC